MLRFSKLDTRFSVLNQPQKYLRSDVSLQLVSASIYTFVLLESKAIAFKERTLKTTAHFATIHKNCHAGDKKIRNLVNEKLSIPPKLPWRLFKILQRDAVVISIDIPSSPFLPLPFSLSAAREYNSIKLSKLCAGVAHNGAKKRVGCVSRPRRIASPTTHATRSDQTVTYFPYGISFKNSKELSRESKIGGDPELGKDESEREGTWEEENGNRDGDEKG